MRTISSIISTIFHPIFIPIIGFYLIRILGGSPLYLPPAIFRLYSISILLFTICIPLLAILLFLKFGKVKSIELEHRNERPLPLLINLICISALWFISTKLFSHIIYEGYFATLTLIYTFSFLISLKYKISLHAIGWGTLLGILTSFSIGIGIPLHFVISSVVLLSSVTLSARLYLKAHTLPEVLWGWSIAFLLGHISMLP